MKDPVENVIKDTRTDSEKVNNIMCIWSQILTQDEQLIWNSIVERDLTKNVSLQSGLQTPKNLIDGEIRAFKDHSDKQKTRLLQSLDKAPDLQPEPPIVVSGFGEALGEIS